MKRNLTFLPFAITVFFVISIVTLLIWLAKSDGVIVTTKGNSAQIPVDMKIGAYEDSDCKMVINDLQDASQIISNDGQSWFFHDHGGMVKWLSTKELAGAKIWVMSRDTHKWIEAKNSYFSVDDKTAMGYGFGAYEQNGSKRVDFDTMRLRMLRGETLLNPLIRKQVFGGK